MSCVLTRVSKGFVSATTARANAAVRFLSSCGVMLGSEHVSRQSRSGEIRRECEGSFFARRRTAIDRSPPDRRKFNAALPDNYSGSGFQLLNYSITQLPDYPIT